MGGVIVKLKSLVLIKYSVSVVIDTLKQHEALCLLEDQLLLELNLTFY